ncbi:hypothetical protein [Streptomyces cinerochromogenes]|uniref:hypothetical protein n=1 Tax=Streptomyces cinerochromogenes TaxID=66422 RepID=UPI001E514027|nr:hypothetical protein [Streptomyces cinerochromogenes]
MSRSASIRAVLQTAVPWLAAAAVVVYGAWQQGLLSWGGAAESGPARAVALPGGGVSAGRHCGAAGYHYFPLPASASLPPPAEPPPGPQLVLGSYGYERLSRRAPGRLTVSLLLAPSPKGSPRMSRLPAGEGVAVEIEGPDGLVGGAHDLPVTWTSSAGYGRAELSLPPEALCPGQDARTVANRLSAPIDSSNTVTGQPPYTLTVSVRDRDLGLLSANNLLPLDAPGRAPRNYSAPPTRSPHGSRAPVFVMPVSK